MVLLIHEERLDKMDLIKLINEFVARETVCEERFGTFAKRVLLLKLNCKTSIITKVDQINETIPYNVCVNNFTVQYI